MLALLLCLVLCVFAFASCNKDKKGASSTTAADTTPATTAGGTTAHVHVPAADYTVDVQPTCAYPGSKSYHCTVCEQIIPETVAEVPALPHTPDSDYTILAPATCANVGYKVYLCAVCGATMDDTIEEIPVNNNAHVVEEWTVTEEATLLHPTGSRYGFCTACNQNIVEETAFLPSVYDVSDYANNPGGLTFPLSRHLKADVLDGDHFYPTDTNPGGKDFVFEMAILWNETMLNCATDECEIALLSGGSDPLYTFVPVNNGSGWCKYAGGFDFSSRTKTVLYGPASGDSQPRENYTFIGEYGWHKVAVRLHEEAAIKNNAVTYAMHGPANEKPLFLTRNVYDYGTSKVVGRHQEHIKLELVDSKSAVVMNGIAFGQSAAARYIKSKRSFDIVYTVEENTYKRGEVQLQIEDISPSEE